MSLYQCLCIPASTLLASPECQGVKVEQIALVCVTRVAKNCNLTYAGDSGNSRITSHRHLIYRQL